jgi:arylsulfatase A-like enzyme/Flp pilus assembly protein TadD
MIPLFFAACTAPAPPAPARPPDTRPDVLLVTIDTLRADRVGAYGDPLASTPHLDALAANSALFRDAYAAATTTLPSHTSILTGRWPTHHGVRDNAGFSLANDAMTLATALRARGYATGAFVSAWVLDPSFGLDAGFDAYDSPVALPAGPASASERAGTVTVAKALAWWNTAAKPRFAWVHVYEPHRPWPETTGDPYRAEVSAADAAIAPILDAAGSDALVVVTGDHGESLWEHGERDHGLLVNRGSTHVPLIVHPPGGLTGAAAPAARTFALDVRRPPDLDPKLVLDAVPDAPRAARVVEGIVSGVDIAPTIADWAGATLPADGTSLRPHLTTDAAPGGSANPGESAYTETFYPVFTFGWSQRCAVRTAARTWEGPRDARTWDPGETASGADDPALADLARARGCDDAPTASAGADPRLEALGYVEGAGELPEGDMDAVVALERAEAEVDPKRATAQYQTLITRYPRLWRARSGLAVALSRTGDLAGALAQLDTPGMPDTVPRHTERGALLLALGRLDDALDTAHHMQALSPRDPAGWQLEVAVLTRRGDADGTERAARLGLDHRPDDPALLYGLGVALSARHADAEALDVFRRAKRAGSQARDLDLQLGLVAQRAGRLDDALQAWADYRAAVPADLRGWAAPAFALFQSGRCADALPLATRASEIAPDDARMRAIVARCGH